MKVWFQVDEQEIQTFDGDPAEVAMSIVEYLARSYSGEEPKGYLTRLTARLNILLRKQYNGAEILGVFGVGDNKLDYEIKIAEQYGDLQDLDFLVPWE